MLERPGSPVGLGDAEIVFLRLALLMGATLALCGVLAAADEISRSKIAIRFIRVAAA